MQFIFGFKTRPVQIEAMRFDGTEEGRDAIQAWSKAVSSSTINALGFCTQMRVHCELGSVDVDKGDWLVMNTHGELARYKDEAFQKKYEPAIRRCDVPACNCGGSHQVSRSVS